MMQCVKTFFAEQAQYETNQHICKTQRFNIISSGVSCGRIGMF